MENFDVIVVGAGHSGIESALASSRIGCKTLLITSNISIIGQMSCNPSIGGIGKSHLVKEIDALDGIMGIMADKSGINFKILNSSKGESVKSTRVQVDKYLYQRNIINFLFNSKNITILQQNVTDLIIINYKIIGIITNLGINIYSKTVILTMGTFLDGVIYIGKNKQEGGIIDEKSSKKLPNNIKNKLSFKTKRFKTGTPPRINSKTINYDLLEYQKSDFPINGFSYIKNKNFIKQINCFITKTNINTHNIIINNLKLSPIYSDLINGIGPRNCPSIEDKVIKFSNKSSHNIFLEPESLFNNEIYPNGISTSLPFEIQIKIINSIKGLEKSEITRPGYAIEYDYFDPRNLKKTLESKIISNLFFAGQINGTTGYEEAASQGILAGINAARISKELEEWIPSRENSYIGVLIDDLCYKGVNEPYRMFTSRSENRLYLREDNADIRLTEIGYTLGVVSKDRFNYFSIKKEIFENEKNKLKNIILTSNYFKNINLDIKLKKNISCYDLLKNNNINYKIIYKIPDIYPIYFDDDLYKNIEIESKYENYIKKQKIENEKVKKYLHYEIPNIDFNVIPGLSNESLYILKTYKYKFFYELYNISGITLNTIHIILLWLKKNKYI